MSAMLEQAAGAALILLFLADVFMTVLYARAGTGFLAPRWSRAIWMLLCAAAALSAGTVEWSSRWKARR